MTLIQAVCEICFNLCQIPVQMICFPCWDSNHKNCNSIKRFCMSCANKYLEFHYPEHLRSRTKKCIYCDAYVDLTTLQKKDCYNIDYLTMSFDTSSQISCIHDHCDYKGSHNDVLRHVDLCKYKIARCMGCYTEVLQKDMESHKNDCPHYIQCHICKLYCLGEHEYTIHVLTCHNLAQCMYCQKLIVYNDLVKHSRDDCECRPVECLKCNSIISKKDEKIHLIQHLQHNQKIRINLMKTFKNIEE